MAICFLNNEFVEEKKALVPAVDRGFLFGDGVFTTILVSDGKVVFLEDHLNRLEDHAIAIGIEPPNIHHDVIFELVRKNKATTGRWRLRILMTGGTNPEIYLPSRKVGSFLMLLRPASDLATDPLRLCIYPERVSSPLAKVKTLAYLNRVWLRDYALKKGFQDSLVLDADQHILEGSMANIFWIQKNIFHFPKRDLPYLMGITLEYLIRAANSIGLEVSEEKASLADLKGASPFLSSSLLGFHPIKQIATHTYKRDLKAESSLRNKFNDLVLDNSFSSL